MHWLKLTTLLMSVALAFTAPIAVRTEEQVEELAVDPDAGTNVVEIVQRRGYAIEEHKVVTADRYVLTMYRLPKSFAETQQNQPAAPNKPAVYLIHGLLDSSFTWVSNFRNQSLAYLLADAGYDVWLGNNRGSTWSRTHLDFTTSDDQFWDFSWEDMGNYDLPAMLNYVLQTSGRPTLSYIGHSEGTTQAFVGFSVNQDLARKVSYFGALAPVAFLGDTTSVVFAALSKSYVDKWFEAFGISEFLPRSPILADFLGKYACTLASGLCDSFIRVLVGNANNLNATRIPVYLGQTPAGTSVKTMAHYAQSIRDNTFRSFNYGCSCSRLLPIAFCSTLICKNKAVYGTFDPPAFNVAGMQYPRSFFYNGVEDSLATPKDIAKLRALLPAGTIVAERNLPSFNHLDFTWAYKNKALFYDEIVANIKLFDGKGY
jgi:pimeloyl-ACP methyl ester carboxylesterase